MAILLLFCGLMGADICRHCTDEVVRKGINQVTCSIGIKWKAGFRYQICSEALRLPITSHYANSTQTKCIVHHLQLYGTFSKAHNVHNSSIRNHQEKWDIFSATALSHMGFGKSLAGFY